LEANISNDELIKPQPNLQSVAQSKFEKAACAAGFGPENKWVDGYFEYEWAHLRPLLGAYNLAPYSRRVLEFGCNVGASSIVMAALGGNVTGIDVDVSMVSIATANVERYDMKDKVEITHVEDTRYLPFDNDSFDFILANSVLEYVEPNELHAIIRELYRVLKSDGQLFICGTASRMAPKEIHSERWFVNYLPRAFDRLTGKNLQRGLSPFLLARAIDGYFTNTLGPAWQKGRVAIHGKLSSSTRIFDWIWRTIGASPGWASPNIELLLRKN
jgi:SAM-dependent methyltransferase